MPSVALNSFLRSLRNLDFTQQRMEQLYQDGKISLRDLHSVYEALFLRAVTSFEVFLEELFISILSGRTRLKGRNVKVRMKAISEDAMKEILLQGNKYLNWLPFDHTEKRALLYLKNGLPFSNLNGGDRSMIKTVTTIRHAIAHKSAHATKEFKRTVIGSQLLLRGERQPAGFLRSQVHPGTNRFMIYTSELAKIATVLG